MKFYVAGKYEDDRVREVMDAVRASGHSITFDWTEKASLQPREKAVADLAGVLAADALIAVLWHDYDYRGTLVEMGAALAAGKPVIYMLGPDTEYLMAKLLFLHHPGAMGVQNIVPATSLLRKALLQLVDTWAATRPAARRQTATVYGGG